MENLIQFNRKNCKNNQSFFSKNKTKVNQTWNIQKCFYSIRGCKMLKTNKIKSKSKRTWLKTITRKLLICKTKQMLLNNNKPTRLFKMQEVTSPHRMILMLRLLTLSNLHRQSLIQDITVTSKTLTHWIRSRSDSFSSFKIWNKTKTTMIK